MTSAEWEAVAVLAEPRRREVYEFVVNAAGPVSRDDVVDALGLARSTAAFHLDKLAEADLVEVSFAYPAGRRPGPGAGRPSKLYGRAQAEVAVSVPPRRYDLAGTILARALASDEPDPRAAAERIARADGREIGAQYRQRLRPNARRAQQLVDHALTDCGFAPQVNGSEIELRNCPFHSLAAVAQNLICGLNQAFISGVIEGVGGDERLTADLVGADGGGCCVAVRRGRGH
jgi:predicted ArsR family transcriptional regulator